MTNTLYDQLIAPHMASQALFAVDDAGQGHSYAQFAGRTAQIAHVLVSMGLTPGDRVLVQGPKTLDFIALYLATVAAGGVFLPLNPAYTRDEVGYFVGDAAPRIVVCGADQLGQMQDVCAGTDAQLMTLTPDGAGSLQRRADAQPTTFDPVPRGPDDLAALLYTSGTTGRSKGAMMSHRNLLSNAVSLVDLWGITDADRLIHALPVFHTHGLFVAMNTCLLAGAQVRFMAGFDLDAIVDEMQNSTLLMGVPTFYTRLLSDARLTPETTANMRLFISGSAPLLAETHADFTTRTGRAILERYGMTETNMISSNPLAGDRVAGTVGYALPGVEVRVIAGDDPAPTGEIGMVEVRGANVFQGYWNMLDKTKAELRDDGFFITGDLGQMDTDGRLSIVGRGKDLIITGGLNVYPKEIEDALNACDGVLESAVFGLPDADFGEQVAAALVMVEGTDADTAQIAQTIAPQLARFKQPKRYEVMAELPRNAMGKVQKNVLRDRFG